MNIQEFAQKIGVNQITYYTALLYAQAVHETGYFSSTLFKEHNNLFGMKPAQMRPQFYNSVVTLGNETFASYSNLEQSFKDRKNLDENNQPYGVQTLASNPFGSMVVLVGSAVEFSQYPYKYMQSVLQKGYATDPNYLQKWENIYNDVFKQMQQETQSNQGNSNSDTDGQGGTNTNDGSTQDADEINSGFGGIGSLFSFGSFSWLWWLLLIPIIYLAWVYRSKLWSYTKKYLPNIL